MIKEKRVLLRFAGFGPVALSIFPDPVTGRYKAGWQPVGEELQSLLSPEELEPSCNVSPCSKKITWMNNTSQGEACVICQGIDNQP